MKNYLLAAFSLLTVFSMSAQEGLGVGVNLGIPTADASDASDFQFGFDANYLTEISDGFKVGGATGFINVLTNDIEVPNPLGGGTITLEVDDIQFIPLAAAARYSVTDGIYVGADLGYALGLNDGNDGGFYYRPMAGYNVTDNIDVNLSYMGISQSVEGSDDNFNFGAILLGAMYHF